MRIRFGITMSALTLICTLLPTFGQNAAKPPTPAIVVNPDGILVRTLVTDPLNRYISGLRQDNFQILEDRVPQTITSFTTQSAPISMGIVFDLNGRMKNSLWAVVSTIDRLRKLGSPRDEFFLIPFNRPADMETLPYDNLFVQREDALSQLPGRPSLREAVAKAMDWFTRAKNDKKVLVLVAERSFNARLNSPWEVWGYTKQAEVEVYSIGDRSPINSLVALPRTNEVREFFPSQPSDLAYYIELVQTEVRNQYIVGYTPTNRRLDGKWRKIEVRLNPPRDLPKLSVIVAPGYYAPRD